MLNNFLYFSLPNFLEVILVYCSDELVDDGENDDELDDLDGLEDVELEDDE